MIGQFNNPEIIDDIRLSEGYDEEEDDYIDLS